MHSRWSDGDARAAVEVYGAAGASEALALRVYTSRLLGQRARAGAARRRQHLGQDRRWRIWPARRTPCCASRAAAGTWRRSSRRACRPCRLAPLRKLRRREALSDDDMVRVQRANLLDPTAPTPSVETLLHAFMPHKFVDHTHSTAVLSLVDQPDGAELCARGVWRAHGLRALHHAGFRTRQSGSRRLRRRSDRRGLDPRQARHLHLRRHARARPTSA